MKKLRTFKEPVEEIHIIEISDSELTNLEHILFTAFKNGEELFFSNSELEYQQAITIYKELENVFEVLTDVAALTEAEKQKFIKRLDSMLTYCNNMKH